jgi:hypothetical protein
VHRIESELGGHSGLSGRALSKQEVSAALCRMGVQAGLWAIPEYEVGNQAIDVVWATRTRGANSLWKPVAAFEIEGQNVALGSIRKNAHSLTAAANAGAIVRAMVLFQVGPDGRPWYPLTKAKRMARADMNLAQFLKEMGSPHSVEVAFDEDLGEHLRTWTQRVAS